MDYWIGIDLGGSSIKAVAVTLSGENLARTTVPFADDARMDWAAKIRAIYQQFQQQVASQAPGASAACLRGVGLSAPGLAAADSRSIFCMPGRLQGLEGLHWTEYLNAPCPVPVSNDAQSALLGEAWLGAARGFRNVILLTLGTGVGGAAISDGRLLRGHIGRAGHFGHMCVDANAPNDIYGLPGSLEAAIGNYSIQERTSGRFQTTHDLVAAHGAGDRFAGEVWLKSVRQLACAVASLINILDPEAVIIGGGISRAGQALFEPLQQLVREIEWQPGGHRAQILPAQLGELAGAYGAAWNALSTPR